MAHTSRMDESDKCATKGFTSLRKDFFDSLTGSYVDISFKTMGVMSILMVLLVSPLLYLRYTTGGMESLYTGLTYLAPSFVVSYFIGYYWVYHNVYTPVHEISTRLLAEQQSIDAWPDNDAVRGKDILDWQYKEIESLLEAIIDLQERADKLGRGELNVAEMRREVEQGRTFVDAAESVAEDTDREGEMIETFQGMALAMRKLAYQARLIADGDLADDALEVEIEGDLGQAFQDMVSNLQEFVAEVLEGVHEARSVSAEVDQAAEELNKASQELSSGAQESASSLEETSSSVEEIASMVEESSENANRCETLSEEAVEAARNGQERIDSMASTMETINEDSDKIAEAIDMIDDIAFQTNLLALNAAVEAANAGEHGEGFAVVADEVRELAQRSSDAAEEISEVIEESTERVEEGTKQAEKSREALDEINDKISEVRERVQEVNAAQKEQSSGIDEINRAVTELESVTEQNTANADQTASASDELASQSRSLEKTVERLSNVAGQFEIDRRFEGTEGMNGNSRGSTTASAKTDGEGVSATNTREQPRDDAEDVIPLEEDNPDF